MQRGDTSSYSDSVGGEHVAVVTETHDDGSVDTAVLKTTLRAIPRSSVKAGGTFFDPSWVDESVAPVAPVEPPNAGLSSVPLVTDAMMNMANPNYSNLLQGSSSPAGLWPPRNLDPVPDGMATDLAGAEIHAPEAPVETPAHGEPREVLPPGTEGLPEPPQAG